MNPHHYFECKKFLEATLYYHWSCSSETDEKNAKFENPLHINVFDFPFNHHKCIPSGLFDGNAAFLSAKIYKLHDFTLILIKYSKS